MRNTHTKTFFPLHAKLSYITLIAEDRWDDKKSKSNIVYTVLSFGWSIWDLVLFLVRKGKCIQPFFFLVNRNSISGSNSICKRKTRLKSTFNPPSKDKFCVQCRTWQCSFQPTHTFTLITKPFSLMLEYDDAAVITALLMSLNKNKNLWLQ